MRPIYLDYDATTPIDPQVLKAMMTFFKENFGNPSSNNAYGKAPKEAIIKGREQAAKLIGAQPDEIIFMGGGTESNNQAIIGTALAHRGKGKHIITSAVEHQAVSKPIILKVLIWGSWHKFARKSSHGDTSSA